MRIKSFSRDRRPDTFWRGILLLLTETPSNGNCSALVLEVPNRCSTHWSKRRAVWKAEHPSVLSHTKTDHHQCVEIFRAREALKRSSALIPSFAQMRKFQQPTYFWEAIPLIVFWNVKSKETDPKSLKKKKRPISLQSCTQIIFAWDKWLFSLELLFWRRGQWKQASEKSENQKHWAKRERTGRLGQWTQGSWETHEREETSVMEDQKL